ncbi:hypothetical protein GCM10009543_38550 [Leifsonia naganoensis]
MSELTSETDQFLIYPNIFGTLNEGSVVSGETRHLRAQVIANPPPGLDATRHIGRSEHDAATARHFEHCELTPTANRAMANTTRSGGHRTSQRYCTGVRERSKE